MREIHRSPLLDLYIDKDVKITFVNGKTVSGILVYTERYYAPLYLKPELYHLKQDNGIYYGFRKSHVRKIEPKK